MVCWYFIMFALSNQFYKMKKIELILVSLAVIAFGLNLFLVEGSSLLLIFSVIGLLFLYFYLGFAILNGITFRTLFKKETYKNISSLRIFGSVATGIIFSIMVLGVVFKYLMWPGGSMMLLISFVGILIIFIVALIKNLKKPSKFYQNVLLRCAVYGGVACFFFFTKASTFIAIKYKDYPEYVKAFEKTMEDPSDDELWQKVDEEREKIDNAEE